MWRSRPWIPFRTRGECGRSGVVLVSGALSRKGHWPGFTPHGRHRVGKASFQPFRSPGAALPARDATGHSWANPAVFPWRMAMSGPLHAAQPSIPPSTTGGTNGAPIEAAQILTHLRRGYPPFWLVPPISILGDGAPISPKLATSPQPCLRRGVHPSGG